MDPKTLVVGVVVGAATAWAARRVVKGLGLPSYTTPIATAVIGPYLHKAVRKIV